MQHLQPNTPLQGGKYRIERVLGQGGFGITYLAEQVSLNRKVAIKEFFMKDFCSRDEMTQTMTTPSTGSSKLVEQYRRKFIKEARNLARLNHPNIINVIDVFEENDTVYYVMPYLAGGSLQDYVKTHGVLSEQEAMKYIRQIARALKYMHEEQSICHYDVKPANILLDDKGNAVLIDFGISKNYDAQGLETTTTPIGVSEGYAPIEQYQQNVGEFSPVSDVYALGATFYFLLHGKSPASAVHRVSGIPLIISNKLSQEVKDIINNSMKISKKDRAQSVDVFVAVPTPSPKFTRETEGSNYKRDSYIAWIIVIVVVGLLAAWSVTAYLREKDNKTITDNIVETQKVALPTKAINLKGQVANIGFTMQLNIKGEEVVGTEHYDNQNAGKNLTIRGVVNQDDTMILDEYDGNTKAGSFTGILGSNTYSGTFTNSKGKQFGFKSKIIDDEALRELEQEERSVKDSYISILETYARQYKEDEWWSPCYFLFDITRDGIPELWILVKDGTVNSIDVLLFVYTYKNGLQSIFNGSYGHPYHNSLFKGDGYILKVFAHMGEASWSKYEYTGGSIFEHEVFSEELNGDQEYRMPTEPEVPTYKLTDEGPIKNLRIVE